MEIKLDKIILEVNKEELDIISKCIAGCLIEEAKVNSLDRTIKHNDYDRFTIVNRQKINLYKLMCGKVGELDSFEGIMEFIRNRYNKKP